MEEDAEGVAPAGPHDRDPVPDRGGRPAAAGRDRPVPGGEDHALQVRKQGRGAARLSPWTLLDEEELAACVVVPGVVRLITTWSGKTSSP